MPTYTYRCPACGESVELTLPLANWNDPQTCPCGETMNRIPSSGIGGFVH